MTHRHRALAVALLLACAAGVAHAHKPSDAYVTLRVDGARVEQRVDIALRDLDRDLALDSDDDGALRWAEVRGRWSDIAAAAAAGVVVSAGGTPCRAVGHAEPALDDHVDGAYAVLRTTLDCTAGGPPLALHYGLFAATDPTHRGLVRIVTAGGGETSAVAVPGGAPLRLGASARAGGVATATTPATAATAATTATGERAEAAEAAVGPSAGDAEDRDTGSARGFLGFFQEGMHHIAIGLDHVLFLVTLLMVAVWRRDGPGWVARDDTASAWREAFKLVTAFTVAHSLTLALAAFGVLAPPSRWVESLIAASVLVAALDNLRPTLPGSRWPVVACFGLVHGFGFAGPLQDLGLERGNLAVPLLAFNLGVEAGQLALVAVLLPLACALRNARWYRLGVVRAGSTAIALLALGWVLDRSLQWGML